jgi:menaquinone-dependent protoporphyrinogen IX oxidase
LKRFDHLVVGGAIRANAMPEELQDFIKENQKIIQERVRGYFAVCGNRGQPPEREQTVQFIDNNLAQLCGVKDLPSRVFLGRITKSLMEPQVAQRMASFEDYDNLKRYECMAFGSEVLGSI